jgi:hypothetical protein
MIAAMPPRPGIPALARERVVERHPNDAKSRSRYYLDGAHVGEMLWEPDGRPSWGWGLKNGKRHGMSVEWWGNGVVSFAEPYVDGLVHGVVRHWDESGALLVSTRYVRGTGVDLWCDPRNRTLAEETRLRAGAMHGTSRRWLDARSIHEESQFREGREHGIFREWNDSGRLRRGFPRYFIAGKRVDRRRYLSAAARDATLPPWRAAEDRPARPLPPEVAGQPIGLELARKRLKAERR